MPASFLLGKPTLLWSFGGDVKWFKLSVTKKGLKHKETKFLIWLKVRNLKAKIAFRFLCIVAWDACNSRLKNWPSVGLSFYFLPELISCSIACGHGIEDLTKAGTWNITPWALLCEQFAIRPNNRPSRNGYNSNTSNWTSDEYVCSPETRALLPFIPSKILKSTAWWWVSFEIVRVAWGSQITMSASDPTWIRPFCG